MLQPGDYLFFFSVLISAMCDSKKKQQKITVLQQLGQQNPVRQRFLFFFFLFLFLFFSFLFVITTLICFFFDDKQELLRQIQQNQQAFINLINEPLSEGATRNIFFFFFCVFLFRGPTFLLAALRRVQEMSGMAGEGDESEGGESFVAAVFASLRSEFVCNLDAGFGAAGGAGG
jgi:ABC-type Fe3+ transport system permease subunit